MVRQVVVVVMVRQVVVGVMGVVGVVVVVVVDSKGEVREICAERKPLMELQAEAAVVIVMADAMSARSSENAHDQQSNLPT